MRHGSARNLLASGWDPKGFDIDSEQMDAGGTGDDAGGMRHLNAERWR